MIRRLLSESDIEAFDAIFPIVTDWVRVEHETQTRLFLTDETETSDSGREHKTEICSSPEMNALNQTTKNPFTYYSGNVNILRPFSGSGDLGIFFFLRGQNTFKMESNILLKNLRFF